VTGADHVAKVENILAVLNRARRPLKMNLREALHMVELRTTPPRPGRWAANLLTVIEKRRRSQKFKLPSNQFAQDLAVVSSWQNLFSQLIALSCPNLGKSLSKL
jgi:hypothetical protein